VGSSLAVGGIAPFVEPDDEGPQPIDGLGLGFDQCNIFLARNDAPKFGSEGFRDVVKFWETPLLEG
jgi:hypothetical protein